MNPPPPAPDERFADWVDGRLSAPEQRRLQRELDTDPVLRDQLASYIDAVEQLRRSGGGERAPVNLADAVMAEIDGGETAPVILHPSRRWMPLAGSLAAAAAMVAIGVFLWGLDGRRAIRTDTASRAPGLANAPATEDGAAGKDDIEAGVRFRSKKSTGELSLDGLELAASAEQPQVAYEEEKLAESLRKAPAVGPTSGVAGGLPETKSSDPARAEAPAETQFDDKQGKLAADRAGAEAPDTSALADRTRGNKELENKRKAGTEGDREADARALGGRRQEGKPLPPLPYPVAGAPVQEEEEQADEDAVAARTRERRAATPAQPKADSESRARYIAKGEAEPPAAMKRGRPGGADQPADGNERVVGFPVAVVTVPETATKTVTKTIEREVALGSTARTEDKLTTPSWMEPSEGVAARIKLLEIPREQIAEAARDQPNFAQQKAQTFQSTIRGLELMPGDRVFALTGQPSQVESYLSVLNSLATQRGGQVRLMRTEPKNDVWLKRLAELQSKLGDEKAKQVAGETYARRAQAQQLTRTPAPATDTLWIVLRAKAAQPSERK